MADFGQFPLSIIRNEDDTYSVSQADQPKADECGINATFDASRLAIMQARGAAYGYVLIEQVALPAPSKKNAQGG